MTRDEWPAAYLAGATVEQIALDAPASPDTVRRVLKAAGVTMRPATPRKGSKQANNVRARTGPTDSPPRGRIAKAAVARRYR